MGGAVQEDVDEGTLPMRTRRIRETDAAGQPEAVRGLSQVPGVLPEVTIAPIRYAISTLYQRRNSLAFAFVYDEFGAGVPESFPILGRRARPNVTRSCPDFWVCTSPQRERRGMGYRTATG